MNWKLKERDTGMYTIFEVIDEDRNNNNKNHNLIARFVTDDKDYTEIKKKAQLIAAAPKMMKVLMGVEQDMIMNGQLTDDTFRAVQSITNIKKLKKDRIENHWRWADE